MPFYLLNSRQELFSFLIFIYLSMILEYYARNLLLILSFINIEVNRNLFVAMFDIGVFIIRCHAVRKTTLLFEVPKIKLFSSAEMADLIMICICNFEIGVLSFLNP